MVCSALAGMQGRAQGLDLLASLPAEQIEAAGLLPVLTHYPPAGLQPANTEAMSAEGHLTTLSHSMPSRTAGSAVAPTEMHPTPGTRTIPDPARMTSPEVVTMTGTGRVTEVTTAAEHMIGTLAAEEEGAPATAQAAGLLHVAENGKGTSLVAMIAAATDRRKAVSMTGTAAETTEIRPATIVMTETGTQDPTERGSETEAVAETGTCEAGTPCLTLHSSARQIHSQKRPLPHACSALLAQAVVQCQISS